MERMETMGHGWGLGPFTRHGRVLAAGRTAEFLCPVAGRPVAWAAKDVFNPGAVVRQGRVCLVVRGEDAEGRYAGTSRLGLATSADGLAFDLEPEPVLFPADDVWQAWEWPGGLEDPRVVEAPDGTYVCTYTAFDGKAGCLFVATSSDLRTWEKRCPAFAGTTHVRRWSKSGSIVTEVRDGRLVACRVDGRFRMLWGEGTVYAATSDDLVRWTPVEFEPDADRFLAHDADAPAGPWAIHRVPGRRVLRPVLGPRRHRFDSLLVEPGPPAVVTDAGIVLIVNGANHPGHGDTTSPPLAYQPGQVLLDAADPTAVLARATEPFLRVANDEVAGQVGNVCFAQGLVLFAGRWWLYHGMADSSIGAASAPAT